MPEEAQIAASAEDIRATAIHSGRMSSDVVSTPVARRIRLSPRGRRWVLTVHIAGGVGLLGSVAAVLAVNIRAAATADSELAAASYELLAMFTLLLGIPLSF